MFSILSTKQKTRAFSLPLPELRHLLGSFVEGGDDFGVGEGAGVDADFVVGRGDESAEDEHRGLLPRRLACAFAEAGVVLVEFEKHSLPRFFTSQGVEMRLAIDKALAMTDGLHFAKCTNQGHPLRTPTPGPENAVILAVGFGRDLENVIVLRAKTLVRCRSPDLDCERGERDSPGGELQRRAGLKRDNAVLRLGIAVFGRRDVSNGIGESVREGPAMDEAGGIRGAR